MCIRDRKKISEEKLTLWIEITRKIISLVCVILFSSLLGVINSLVFVNQHIGVPIFEIPSQFVNKLSLIGFMFSGFLIGIGNMLCEGGVVFHLIYGVPTFSAKSFIIGGISFGSAVLSSRVLEMTETFLNSTQILYLHLLDNASLLSASVCSSSFCVLMILGFIYLSNANLLEKFMMTKRGFFFIFFNFRFKKKDF